MSFCAAVALILVILAILITVGCKGVDTKWDQDLHLIKLNQDGSVAWTKIINSGKDDEINEIIQTADGGYLIAGGSSTPVCNQHTHNPTTSTLTRLSSEGNILWTHDYQLMGKGVDINNDPDEILAIFQTLEPDPGFLIISRFGLIEKVDDNGNIQWNHSISDNRALQLVLNSAITTKDYGYLLGGTAVCCDLSNEKNYTMMLTKLDDRTNQSWTKIYYNSDFYRVYSLIELENNSGFVGLEKNTKELVLFDTNGSILESPYVSEGKQDKIYKLQEVGGGFYAYSSHWKSGDLVEEMHFNNDGKLMGNRTLFNITHSETLVSPGSDETLLKKDSGYLTIDAGHARLLTANGSVIWDKEIISLNGAKNPPRIHVRHIIDTDDGGFLVVFGIEKWTSC